MTREEAIQELQNCKGLIQQDGQDYLDERDIPLLDMAIEALSSDAVHDGCDGCRYEQNTEHEYPCKDCKQNYMDMWEQKPNDSVSVVRCKECKWYKKIVEKSKSGLCHYDLVARCLYDEDFCSHGERQEP